jgi:hypothetical protein
LCFCWLSGVLIAECALLHLVAPRPCFDVTSICGRAVMNELEWTAAFQADSDCSGTAACSGSCQTDSLRVLSMRRASQTSAKSVSEGAVARRAVVQRAGAAYVRTQCCRSRHQSVCDDGRAGSHEGVCGGTCGWRLLM